MSSFNRFSGASRYIADDVLLSDVNAAMALGRPLLVRGEPGTGKTMLAHAIAESLEMPLMTWHVKSTTTAQEGRYHYDVVQRLNDSRFGDVDGIDVRDIRRYIKLGVLGRAFTAERPVVLLIDEIDKADVEFPNDLLRELDEMAFAIPELEETVRAERRPVTIITSNAEKELPDAFLRRCVFHYIRFPEQERVRRIVQAHMPDLEERLVNAAIVKFYEMRAVGGLRKKPSTSELLDWLLVLARAGVRPEQIARKVPFMSVLVKQEKDLELLARRFGEA
ncbi:MAG: ATP-binding protein [Deltaproteobacteria bacterium]|nr:ATP-binding protein [Deltaproteobacteria bacterium]HCH65513.1 MoxR family ATPase [Deltaproteobacteria bacterium]